MVERQLTLKGCPLTVTHAHVPWHMSNTPCPVPMNKYEKRTKKGINKKTIESSSISKNGELRTSKKSI